MIKKTVSYEDFDGNKQVRDLYFHISKTDLMDHLELEGELVRMAEALQGKERNLTTDEVQQMLDLIKTFVQMGYGERSEDGQRFVKNETVWENFRYTPAYDEFLFGLFENPEEAMAFLNDVFPKDLMAQAKAEMEKNDKPKAVKAAPKKK